MGFAPLAARIRVKRTGLKTGHYKTSERYGSSIFPGNTTGCGCAEIRRVRNRAQRNGFVSGGSFASPVSIPHHAGKSGAANTAKCIAAVSAGRHPCSAAWHESPLSKNRERPTGRCFARPAFHFESANNLLSQRIQLMQRKSKKYLSIYCKP
jgi:hypothetical protein